MNGIVPHKHIDVAGVVIAQDQAGRYCLNDLHKASGNEARHQPARFLANQYAQDLVNALSTTTEIPVVTVNGGRQPGTFVCREIVYAYAAWLSADFHVKVIRTFDAVASGDIVVAQQIARPKTDSASMERNRDARSTKMAIESANLVFAMLPGLGDAARQVIAAKLINAAAGAEIVPLPILQNFSYSATDIGEKIGISATMVGRIANSNGLKTPKYGHIVLDKSASSDKQVETFRYNDAGVARITELARAAS